jgi:anti-sigma regulatory factor (Ser/Thr protein kinase)
MRWSGTFGPNADNAGRARAAVGQALDQAGLPPAVIGDALLVLGEIIGNAVRHARTDFTISATLAGGLLRLEVFDRDTRPPALLGLDDESTSGRGLHLVSAVATAWGWHTAEGSDGVSGKLVWAELEIDQ